MLAQIAFEPGQFPRRPSVRPAVVQHGDMHTAGIEAVVRRPPRILAEQPLRRLTPYIVIAGREVKWNPPVGPDEAHRLPPLGFRRSVVQPLYGVAGRHHEGRLRSGQLPPDAFIDTRLRFPRAVAQQYEMEVIRGRGADRQPCRHHQAAEPRQNTPHHGSPAGPRPERHPPPPRRAAAPRKHPPPRGPPAGAATNQPPPPPPVSRGGFFGGYLFVAAP